MVRLAKYLKPFMIGLLFAVALLFLQAICDLNLPNYMSNIVNTGIQQNGIEHAAPDAISSKGMLLMTRFMKESDIKTVMSAYTAVLPTDKNANGKLYKDIYPNASEQFYVINKLDKTSLKAVDDIFGASSLTFVNIMKEISKQSGQAADNDPNNDTANNQKIDLELLYGMRSMFESEQFAAMLGTELAKTTGNEDLIGKQSGIMFAKAFYEELGANMGAKQTNYIFSIGVLMLLIALIGGVATVLVGFISAKVATGVARNLRRDLFSKVENFANNEFDKFSTASLITRCTNDVTQIQMLVMMGIRMICYSPIIAIGGIIMALNKSMSMSWIIALAVCALISMIVIVVTVAMPKFKIIQKLVDKLNLVSRESLSGLMVIRAFGTQECEKQRFDKANKDLTGTSLFVNRVMVFMMPVMMFIMNGTTLLIIWVGAKQVADSSMQVGDMMAFMQYAMQIIMSFLMMSMMFIMVPRAAVSAGRIADVLETDFTILDPVNPKEFDKKKKGLVEFKNVHFRYQNAEEDALSNINFTAKPGQTTAIIGSTGSGKSTIANLVLRFYDVSSGKILVDGTDIKEVKQGDLRAKIGYVPQKGVLLSGTIAYNLKYGNKNASDDEMETVAKIAQAEEFIKEKPEQFESVIAQGGSNVSGGQKQRLSIARALAKKPEILIFDDSFSALDFKTDSALRKALFQHASGSTLIIVAQRVSTIMHAEQIIVLEKGSIVGQGTHAELLKNCPEYYEIASSQLSKEELA